MLAFETLPVKPVNMVIVRYQLLTSPPSRFRFFSRNSSTALGFSVPGSGTLLFTYLHFWRIGVVGRAT
jgi:hypothetical protein